MTPKFEVELAIFAQFMVDNTEMPWGNYVYEWATTVYVERRMLLFP